MSTLSRALERLIKDLRLVKEHNPSNCLVVTTFSTAASCWLLTRVLPAKLAGTNRGAGVQLACGVNGELNTAKGKKEQKVLQIY